MKNTAKKLLCLVLVVMLAIPFAAFSVSAAATYADFEEGDLMYTVNFKGGDGVFETPKPGWAGMKTATVSSDGSSVTLVPKSASGETGAVWGNCLAYPDYRMLQSSYTVVFTLTAEDENQEIGLFLDWNSGFILKPGSNSYRYGVGKDGTTIEGTSGTYEGKTSLKQTYAIEIKDEGTSGSSEGKYKYNITEYNLYVVQDGEWNLLFALSDSKNADAAEEIKSNLKWVVDPGDNYEFVLRFFRNVKDENQTKEMTVGDMDIYKGLAVSDGYVSAPQLFKSYAEASDGELLYIANFNGDSIYQEVGDGWALMATKSLANDGKAVVLKPKRTDKNEAAVFGGYMDTTNYPARGNAYTMAFTVTASASFLRRFPLQVGQVMFDIYSSISARIASLFVSR